MKQRIGRYEVVDQLGQGATAIVYRAHDTQIGRVVALKTLRPDLAVPREMRDRFVQEAKAAGQLSHPGIVAVHDVLDVDGDPCIVMECVEGRSLAELVAADGPLDVGRARRVIAQLCGAMDYAHARGVLHRDIKTSNVLLAPDGSAKLGDFGIARLPGSHLTQTGAMLGTPAYMAPEAIRGKGVDERSDVFSLGVVLYELLTGANPFLKEDLAATLYEIVHGDPAPAHERNAAVPPALGAVVATALAKDPAQRFESARAFADAVAQADRPSPARPRPPRVPRSRASQGVRAAAVAAGAALLIAGGWTAWRLWPVATPPAPSALAHATARPAPAAPALPPPVPAAPPAPAVEATPPRRSDPPPPPAAARTASVERPSPPRSPRPPVRTPAPPRTASVEPPPPVPFRPGAIVVRTNPGVEIFVDGAFKASTGEHPMVVPNVPPGERSVVLRLGPYERALRGTVVEDQRLALTYYFEGQPKARNGFARDVEGFMRQAGDKVRDAVEDGVRSMKRRGGDD